MNKNISWILLSFMFVLVPTVHAKDNTGFTGAKGKPFQYLQQQIDAMQTDPALVAQLQARIGQLEDSMAVLQTQMNSSGQDMEGLRAQMDTVLEEIDMLEANLASLQESLNEGCPAGYSLRRVTEDGTVLCETSAGVTSGETTLFLLSRSSTVNVPAGTSLNGSQTTVSAICPSGYLATGGGYMTIASTNLSVVESSPYSSIGWTGKIVSKDPSMQPFTVYVKCARLL